MNAYTKRNHKIKKKNLKGRNLEKKNPFKPGHVRSSKLGIKLTIIRLKIMTATCT